MLSVMVSEERTVERTVGYILTGPYRPTSPPASINRLQLFLLPEDILLYEQADAHHLIYPRKNSAEEQLIQRYAFLSTRAFNAAYRVLRKATDELHYNIKVSLFSVIRDPPLYESTIGRVLPTMEDLIFYEQLARLFHQESEFEQACADYTLYHEKPISSPFKEDPSSVKELARGDWHIISIFNELDPDKVRYYASKYPPTPHF